MGPFAVCVASWFLPVQERDIPWRRNQRDGWKTARILEKVSVSMPDHAMPVSRVSWCYFRPKASLARGVQTDAVRVSENRASAIIVVDSIAKVALGLLTAKSPLSRKL